MRNIVRLEINSNLTVFSMIILLVFIIFSVGIHQVGISKYKNGPQQNQEFKQVELKKIQSYINYMQFGIYGFRRLLESSPLMSLFYNSTTIDEVEGFIDSGVRLMFSRPEMGKNLFNRPTGGALDYSWYLLLLGALLIMPWCFFSYRNREYIGHLSTYTEAGKVYGGLSLARLLLLTIVMLITVAIAYVQYRLNGISLSSLELKGLAVFFLVLEMVMVFLAAISAALGTIKNWIIGGIITAALGFLLVLLWPEILNVIISGKASSSIQPLYRYELRKTEILMKFEEMGLKNTGRYTTIPEKTESDKRMSDYYWENIRKEIVSLDTQMNKEIEAQARNFHFWSIFTPVTFYKAVNNELSSRGYNTYNAYFKKNLEIQTGFLRYYFDKRFYENYSKVEPYLSEKEIVEKVGPSLPAYFGWGVFIGIVYIVLILSWGYRLFIKWVYPNPELKDTFKHISLDLRKGKIIYLRIISKDFLNQFLNVLRGKYKGPKSNIAIDGKPVEEREKPVIAYIPDPDKIPAGLKVRRFIKIMAGFLQVGPDKIQGLEKELGEEVLNQRLGEVEPEPKARILFKLAILKEAEIYIFHDFFTRLILIPEDFKQDIEGLKKRGAIIVGIQTTFGFDINPDYGANILKDRDGFKQSVVRDYE